MTITRNSNRSKPSKRCRQYVGNIYVRPRRCSSPKNWSDALSDTCNGNTTEEDYFRIASQSESFDTRSSTEEGSIGYSMNVDDLSRKEAFNFSPNYAPIESFSSEKQQPSRELWPKKKRERQPISITMISFGADKRKKQLRKKLSSESHRRKASLRKKSVIVPTTGFVSMDEKEFQTLYDTSAF